MTITIIRKELICYDRRRTSKPTRRPSFQEARRSSLSDFAALSMRERMEDELDRQAYEEAMNEFRANPVTYTLEEVEKELGLS